MYVPNFIPEPLEVPGNITLRPYAERVRFIRTITWIYTASLFAAAAIGFVPHLTFPTRIIGIALLLLLVLLDLFRILLRGQDREAKISSALLPLVLVLFGWLARDLYLYGWPTWAILFGAVSMFLYTLIAGRDYSFVGCYFLSLIFSSIGIAGVVIFLRMPSGLAAKALSINLAFMSYAVYDLASLLARRREGEALAAVTDLYRDVFNIAGYFYRCLHHWKKHRIWITPK